MLDPLKAETIRTFINGVMFGAYSAAVIIFLASWVTKRREEKRCLKVANEVLHEVFPAGSPIVPEMRRTVLTKELMERGPVPDVPAIKWNDHALFSWLKEKEFDLRVPINVSKNIQTGEVIFEQPVLK